MPLAPVPTLSFHRVEADPRCAAILEEFDAMSRLERSGAAASDEKSTGNSDPSATTRLEDLAKAKAYFQDREKLLRAASCRFTGTLP